MDNNITQTVFDSLEASANEINELAEERDTVEGLIKSGRFSQKALTEELYPKRDALRMKITAKSDEAIRKAQGLVDQYKKDSAKANTLNPDDLTDDIKLLQPGIILNKHDIQSMLERNAQNRTMSQIILRYAKEHDIDTGSAVYIGGQEEAAIARNLESVLYLYRKYLGTSQATEMLHKFFNC